MTTVNENEIQLTLEGRAPISRDPAVVSGAAVFPGTRVPVGILFEYLADGYSINSFVEQFPTVSQAQVIAVLDYIRESIHKDDNWYSFEDSPR